MFATIKSLIPEPRQAEQPRHYTGRHRQSETITARAAVTVIPGPLVNAEPVIPPAPPAPAEPAVEVNAG